MRLIDDNAVTFCVSTEEVLGLNPPPPEKTAVIECAPTGSVIPDKDAALEVTDTVPSELAPSKNSTEPVDATSGAIVAVNVMVLLSQAGFLLVVSVVVVGCPKADKLTDSQQPATNNSFLRSVLVFKI